MKIKEWFEKKKVKKEVQDDLVLDILEGDLIDLGDEIHDTVAKLSETQPDDPNYVRIVRCVDGLSDDMAELLERYESIKYPSVRDVDLPWFKKIDWTKVATCVITCVASSGQVFLIYKLQRDGYLIKRDVQTVQLPKL